MIDRIPQLEQRLGACILAHRSLRQHLDCGANLAAAINPAVAQAARDANEIAAKLKVIDPNFPASWTPIPEGK